MGLSLSWHALSGVQAPPVLERYEVFEELGHGGMGVVYRAQQRDSGTIVALKVLRKERLGHPNLISRFRREAQAAARLTHPHIVHLVEADLEGPIPYLAMEYVAGIDLQTLVEKIGPLPVAQACDFIRQAAVALQHAHEQGMVHRDVKPSNLIAVSPQGLPLPTRPVLKVLDMGMARLYQLPDEDAPLTTLTRDGSVIGTLDYIAPEQLENPRGVDIRADLYSLGCTFYYLLTGQVPFPGGSMLQKADWQRWKVAPSPDQLRQEIGPGVASLVRKLMQKSAEDRFQTPGELAAALETLLRTGELPGGHRLVSPTLTRSLAGHAAPVVSLAFTADGRTLLSCGGDRILRVWDVETGTERQRLGESRAECGGLAVFGSLVLAGQGVSIRIYDLAQGKELRKLSGHSDAVRVLAVSADGTRAVSGGDDKQVRVWDVERGTQVNRFTRHTAAITGLAFSPDGKRVVSASRDGTLRLWETITGRELRAFAVPKGPVLCVAWSPDGKSIVSGHFDTSIRQWDPETGHELRRYQGHKQMVSALAFTPRGTLLSAGHDQSIRLWDAASGGELGACAGHTGRVLSLVTSKNGDIASGGVDHVIRLWQVPTSA
jgi:WD40 repeat protein/tRNA A-37 threonylcarbamoyl transferase component Bud32